MGIIERIKRFFGFSNSPVEHRNSEVPRDDYSYNEVKAKKKKAIDALLDKINKKGMDSLSAAEKAFLDKESQNL